MAQPCCNQGQIKLLIFGTGALILVIGLILALLLPNIITMRLNLQLQLRNNTRTYNNWIETQQSRYIEVYLFNWTNHHELGKHNFKPKVVEYGPLFFSEKRKRVDIVWNLNHTISFNQINEWHFESTLSNNCTLSEPITQLNVITATIAHLVIAKAPVSTQILNLWINNNGGSLIITKTVRELLFEGYDDNLLNFIKDMNAPIIKLPIEKFGWLVHRNQSKMFDGRFEMYTGTDQIQKLGYLTQWNGADQMKSYENYFNKVNCTTDELWPPSINPNGTLTIFYSDFCRSINIYPDNKMYDLHEIKGNIWKTENRTLDNGHFHMNNFCFYSEDDLQKCLRNGVVDISKCYWNSPVLLSFPHFYLADSSYAEAIDGIVSNADKHEFYLALEAKSGLLMDMNARFQINLMLNRIEGIDIYKNVTKDVVMPMLWINQRFQLDKESATKFKNGPAPCPDLAIAYILIGFGSITLTVGLVLLITKKWSQFRNTDSKIYKTMK